jgi:hypothetical protein
MMPTNGMMPERLLSSPFIRWLLQNQEMMNSAGSLDLLSLLQALQQGTPAGMMGSAPMMAAGAPGMSPEQASIQEFRDLPMMLQMAMTRAGQMPAGTMPSRLMLPPAMVQGRRF